MFTLQDIQDKTTHIYRPLFQDKTTHIYRPLFQDKTTHIYRPLFQDKTTHIYRPLFQWQYNSRDTLHKLRYKYLYSEFIFLLPYGQHFVLAYFLYVPKQINSLVNEMKRLCNAVSGHSQNSCSATQTMRRKEHDRQDRRYSH